MKSVLSRRDFLKLAGMLPLGLSAPRLTRTLKTPGAGPNVVVVVFDAFSAYNISLYGYARKTTPNLARLAQRAIVYHNHFAGSNFTTPGTASLLTGTLPWTHRALRLDGTMAKPFATRSMFHVFRDYFRVAYTHNLLANTLLRQLQTEIDDLIPRGKLLLPPSGSFIEDLFARDGDTAYLSWGQSVNIGSRGTGYSLFVSHLYTALQEASVGNLKQSFPRGLPTGDIDSGFLLEDAVDWLSHLVGGIPRPFIGYFHFLPPHRPYNAPVEFAGRFTGNRFAPPSKPEDVFTKGVSLETSLEQRTYYDEFILYVDREFGRFYDALEASGLLEDTWLVLTSDHGEMFERGLIGHNNPTLYQPVIRVPLLIFEPGREVGMDIHSPTSAVDVLPTLAHVTGHAIPDWTEGLVLPPFASAQPDPNRSVYVVRAAKNEPDAPLSRASTMLVKGRYKLLYFFGYHEHGIDELVKLYDLESDPEELVDLSGSRGDVASELLAELKAKLAEVNRPFV